jgi:hypothetical protein
VLSAHQPVPVVSQQALRALLLSLELAVQMASLRYRQNLCQFRIQTLLNL